MKLKGTVTGIHLAPKSAASMQSVDKARAVPGLGLEGDRYFTGSGTFSKPFPNPDSEVTLIESESLDAFNRNFGSALLPSDARRNIVTRGIGLNDLAGREFSIGAVRFRGHGLCEPCGHLQQLTGAPVHKGLAGSGGLRAQVLSEGTIRLGDTIEAFD